MPNYELLERNCRIQALRSEGKTYEEIGKMYGLTRQRVERICKSKPIERYYSQDITFCSNKKCELMTCIRHDCHIRWDIKPYQSFANFENTKYCLKKKREGAEE